MCSCLTTTIIGINNTPYYTIETIFDNNEPWLRSAGARGSVSTFSGFIIFFLPDIASRH